MSAVVAALIHLVGTCLIGVLMAVGFFSVLVTFLIPVAWAHPFISFLVVVTIAALCKRR